MQKHQDRRSTIDKPWSRRSSNSEVTTDLEEKSEVNLKISNFKEPGNT